MDTDTALTLLEESISQIDQIKLVLSSREYLLTELAEAKRNVAVAIKVLRHNGDLTDQHLMDEYNYLLSH